MQEVENDCRRAIGAMHAVINVGSVGPPRDGERVPATCSLTATLFPSSDLITMLIRPYDNFVTLVLGQHIGNLADQRQLEQAGRLASLVSDCFGGALSESFGGKHAFCGGSP
jgi:hypothetical protein